MKSLAGTALVACVALAAVVHAGPPGPLDLGKRADAVSTDEKAVLPDNKPIEKNEVLQDRRFEAGTVEKKTAIVGEKRSSIAVEEGSAKKKFSLPEQKRYDMIERKESPWAGKTAAISTRDNTYRTRMAERFQDKISEAAPVSENSKPVISRRATFDQVNRFSFRRNGGVGVTAAGGGQAARDISGASAPGGAATESKPAVTVSTTADAPPVLTPAKH